MLSLILKTNFSTSSSQLSCLTLENINQNFRRIEYAVRGPVVVRATQIENEIRNGVEKPFKNVIRANIGDSQAMNQKPITFIRQVLSCALDKSLLKSPKIPDDVKNRVNDILAYCGGKEAGSYTDSCGIEIIRRHVAEYIERRDGGNIKVDFRNVFLCNGASDGIKCILNFINQRSNPSKPVGVMLSKPQYPLYSATICEFGMQSVYYALDEEDDWSLDIQELERAYSENHERYNIRAIVVINPGNPTGSVLSEKNIKQILKFANDHKLIILADEVYQHNIYQKRSEFHSFKKVLTQDTDYDVELFSFMSTSKGYMNECGIRGGFCELHNMNEDVRNKLYEGRSSWLCSNTTGQICVDTIVNPPQNGEPSNELYEYEKAKILKELAEKAKLVVDTFNSMDGITSNPVAGALYAFPKIDMPPKAIEEAKRRNCEPDFLYAMQLVENYGVCVVPGSGFGQKSGTYHFRTTILPPPDIFEDMMDRFKKFHADFNNRYT